MNSSAPQPTCLITGTTGYLGGRIKDAVLQRGWRVVGLNRREGAGGVAFRLGDEVSSDSLAGANALVHCAYDFKKYSWEDIHTTNVVGSEKLLRAAREAKVERLIYISSISAYEGCRSLYGTAKLETERIALSLGATVIRPGLIWGEPSGAMFGKLEDQVQGGRFLPLIGGQQVQYLVHHADLTDFICCSVEGRIDAPTQAVTIAHERGWTFRQILVEIARSKGKRLVFVPVPWRMVWLILKCAEVGGVRLNFRSDSLVSLMYQNPQPSFEMQRQLGIPTRVFRLAGLAAKERKR